MSKEPLQKPTQPNVAAHPPDHEGADLEPTTTAQADRLVMTSWSLNYNQARGAKNSAKVQARDADSALYVDELKISPAADVKESPESLQRTITGVAIGKTGAAHIGTFAHPKGRGGQVSASVGYGTKPKFDFTIETKDAAVAATARRDHARLVVLLADDIGREGFVEPMEAQHALDKLITAQFDGKAVTGKINRVDHVARKAVNTTPLNYAPVNADRAFRLLVAIPTKATDTTVTTTSSKNGEQSTGAKNTKGTTDTHETTVNTTQETEVLSAIESTIKTGFSLLTTQLRSFGFTHELMHNTSKTTDTRVDGKYSLSGNITGSAELDLSKLPLVDRIPGGRQLLGALKGALSFNLLPTFALNTNFVFNGLEGFMQKVGLQHKYDLGSNLATMVDNEVSSSITKHWSTTIATRAHNARVVTQSDEVTGGTKSGGSTTVTRTEGNVQVVESDVQPHLVEE